MSEIDKNVCLLGAGKGVAMHPDTGCRGEFHENVLIIEFDRVIPRRRGFVLVLKVGGVWPKKPFIDG